MHYIFILVALLSLGLVGALGGLAHLLKANGALKEKLELSQAHLNEQNKHIKALELDHQKYLEHKPQEVKIIRERYKDTKSLRELKTCEQQLSHIKHLLKIFKEGKK
ncbi:hypothetical protein HHE06_13670 [Helicobacter heilmannii]|uniref:hypothetical protein n=1 Tax=Helicobacter heilmannii TaxID=35817 RepID=UPI00028A4896|nr:hypothetical protein [Helicobacter heilmannii]CCM11939.1 hypothetical protein BN341_2710 [Helicobacter heilmannii ASB1.4]CCM73466.1 hypothetical protein BN341_8440 [Helicobacter heilmannii ASB1.4]CCM73469.1 hypothetical protein BN341_8470 [Helicobacter heilmannii ASB1.4]CRF49892.1 hypothetical protein HHE03_15700 [Helicobacter heilmannii]CRF51486.1 hypothetical protein HHE06_13670 [Helicobacter heilmannii]